MINRVLHLVTEAQDDDVPYGDFYVVVMESGSTTVSRETAAYIERQLDRRWRRRWLVFRDRAGSRFRVRTRDIELLIECTTEQRARDRRLDRARRKEQDADRPSWEDPA